MQQYRKKFILIIIQYNFNITMKKVIKSFKLSTLKMQSTTGSLF